MTELTRTCAPLPRILVPGEKNHTAVRSEGSAEPQPTSQPGLQSGPEISFFSLVNSLELKSALSDLLHSL